ncbi:DsrE family protein [Algoriphagus machipongonensis]|uniref:Uncharacterized protein n=1 Tax=Algoriphagus machipongonensis TaxID=388413 RepID=A3I0W8_9BACT|nr:DsrE family protein [Algoriphagus machipongonensis]EAZ80114.2 hypothetical protein ALPR1_15834 [Algoriphagus machipongonensis]
MKKVLIIFLLMAVFGTAKSQERPVKIVFDVTSADPSVHQSAMRHITMMSNQYPESEFEMVIYSGSIDMVVKYKSSVQKELEMLASKNNVSFKVCEMTLNRHKLEMSNLIPGVETVPDGILEIIMKQQAGWGYIKESK